MQIVGMDCGEVRQEKNWWKNIGAHCSLSKKLRQKLWKKKNIKQEKKCSHGVHEARRESESLGKKRRWRRWSLPVEMKKRIRSENNTIEMMLSDWELSNTSVVVRLLLEMRLNFKPSKVQRARVRFLSQNLSLFTLPRVFGVKWWFFFNSFLLASSAIKRLTLQWVWRQRHSYGCLISALGPKVFTFWVLRLFTNAFGHFQDAMPHRVMPQYCLSKHYFCIVSAKGWERKKHNKKKKGL